MENITTETAAAANTVPITTDPEGETTTPAAATTEQPEVPAKPEITNLLTDDPDETTDEPTDTPAATAPEGVPEQYTFSTPEGQPDLQTETLTQFTDLARQLGLSNAKAQAALDWYRENILLGINRRQQDLQQTVTQGWQQEIREDRELGGEKMKQTLRTAQGLIKEYPRSAEFTKMLNETGIGNHPEMVRFIHHWGKGLQEDRQLLGGRNSGGRSMTQEQFQALRPPERAKYINGGGIVS